MVLSALMPVESPPRPSGSLSTLVSPGDAGRTNRARLLRLLHNHGPLSFADLARLTGSQRAVVGTVLAPLLEEGILQRLPQIRPGKGGGKPPQPIWFVEERAPIAAVHLMPDRVRCALVGIAGAILHEVAVSIQGMTAEQAAEAIVTCLREIISASTALPVGIGIAIGGMVDTRDGSIVHVELAPHLDGLPIATILKDAFDLPVLVDLHPRAQALGDLWFGAARELNSFCSVYIGEAIGAGFVIEGVLQHGVGGSGGEVGHIVIDPNGPRCVCGQHGCWDVLAALRWLRTRASECGLPDAERMTSERLIARHMQGDDAATAILDEWSAHIAAGLAVIDLTLSPEAIILHGDPGGGGEELRSRVERRLREVVLPHPAREPVVLLAAPDDHATLRGAACLILAEFLRFSV